MLYGKKCPECGFNMGEFVGDVYICEDCGHEEPITYEPTGWSYVIGLILLIMGILYASNADANDDTHYMTEAIYFEARDQVLIGQIAVGCTILNRVNKPQWPNTVRGVVHQPKQFSYYSDGKPEIYNDPKAHYVAWLMAEKVLYSNTCDMFDGIDHYMNHDLTDADWHNSMEFVMKVGDHSFYKRVR